MTFTSSNKLLRNNLALFFLIALLQLMGAFEKAEYLLMDFRFSVSPEREASKDILLVDIDSRSLREIKEWPWSRALHAQAINNLLKNGASKIVLDIDLSSEFTLAGDQVLANTLTKNGSNIALPVFKQDERNIDGITKNIETLPQPLFRGVSKLVSINVEPAIDGKIRQMARVEPFSFENVPTASSYLNGNDLLNSDKFYLDYSINLSQVARLSFIDLINNNFSAKTIANKKIIIGATAIELHDQVPVPLLQSIPGPLLHALAYSSINSERTLVRTANLPTLFITFLILLASPLFSHFSWQRSVLLLLGSTSALLLFSTTLQHYFPVLIDSAAWYASLFCCFFLSIFGHMDKQKVLLFIQNRRIISTDQMMKSVVNNNFDGLLTINQSGEIITFNPAAENIFNIRSNLALNTSVNDIIVGFDLIAHDTDNSNGTVETLAYRNNTKFPVELSISTFNDDHNTLFICTVRDITERKRQTELLQYKANHDDLTGLPNRSNLYERMEKVIALSKENNTQFAFLLIDLDNFKEINDTLGHHIGDKVLITLAKRMLETVTGPITLSRLGGDEFALLLPEVETPDNIDSFANELSAYITKPIITDDLILDIELSIGCSLFPDHGQSIHELLQHADVAMYTSKNNGVLFSYYDQTHDENSLANLSLRSDLKNAVNNNEFTLHYQPKVNLKSHQMSSVEVLIRWVHPEKGFIPPDKFIPLAESTGLITQITKLVLKEALQQCVQWRDAGYNFSAAINASTKDLMDENFPFMILDLLGKVKGEPDWLVIEITESHIMTDPQKAMRTLTTLHDLGFKLSIDDFGTGYSSLAYLKDLPIDELKIDRSFVTDMVSSEEDSAIVRSTIDLAHNLGLSVVAEGVEDDESITQLMLLGCDTAQGYHVSKPVPSTELTKWLENCDWQPIRANAQLKAI